MGPMGPRGLGPWALWAPGAHTANIFRLDTAIIFRLDTAIIVRLDTAIICRLDTAIIFRLDTAIIGPFLEGPSRFFKNLRCSQKCHINDLELLLKSYFRRIPTRICFILQ